jgi:hypothetical protein
MLDPDPGSVTAPIRILNHPQNEPLSIGTKRELPLPIQQNLHTAGSPEKKADQLCINQSKKAEKIAFQLLKL